MRSSVSRRSTARRGSDSGIRTRQFNQSGVTTTSLAKEVSEVETFGFECGVGARLGFPKVQMLVFGGQPHQREDRVDVVSGGKGSGAFWRTAAR